MNSKNDSSRRNFLKKTGLIASLSTLGSFSGLSIIKAGNRQQSEKGKLNKSAKRLMKMLGLKYPIIQAPAAGPAKEELAVAVSNAGALGALPLTWHSPDEAFKDVTAVRSKSKGIFFANYVLNFEPRSLDKAIEAGIKVVQFSWGLPSQEVVKKLKDNSIIMGIQVVSKANAAKALELEPDYLVCQGIEAGGHVHGSKPLMEALLEVLSIAGKVPVVASGGIATGHDIRKYISAGAAGTVLGSRFVATQESAAHPEYKQALLDAKAEDTVFTVCLNNGWSNATHRILRNETFNMWEAAGCPTVGNRPGENEIVATDEFGNKLPRYSGNPPVVGTTGNVHAIGSYAGMGVTKINDLPKAGDLVKRLWAEFENV